MVGPVRGAIYGSPQARSANRNEHRKGMCAPFDGRRCELEFGQILSLKLLERGGSGRRVARRKARVAVAAQLVRTKEFALTLLRWQNDYQSTVLFKDPFSNARAARHNEHNVRARTNLLMVTIAASARSVHGQLYLCRGEGGRTHPLRCALLLLRRACCRRH